MSIEAPGPGSSPRGGEAGPGASSFSVRGAIPGDANGIAAVAAVTFPLACPPSTTDAAKAAFIAAHLTPGRFEEYLRAPSRRLLVAERDGVAIGYTMLVLPAEPSAPPADADVAAAVLRRPTAELSKVYVLPDHHGGGVARRLVEETLRLAGGEGMASVWLGVNQQNARANAFYAKCGFVRVGVKRFLVGDVWEDDFVRELVFPQQAGISSR